MWAGLVISFVSLFVSSFVSSIRGLIVLQGIGFGLGGGMLYTPVIVLLNEWFVRRRGLAGGIIFAGSGVGGDSLYICSTNRLTLLTGFVFPLMVNALLTRVGFRWTLRIWSFIMAAIVGLALLGVNHRVPVPKFHAGQIRPRWIPPQMHFLKRPVFWSFVSYRYYLCCCVWTENLSCCRARRLCYKPSLTSPSPFTSPCSQHPFRRLFQLQSSCHCSTLLAWLDRFSSDTSRIDSHTHGSCSQVRSEAQSPRSFCGVSQIRWLECSLSLSSLVVW